MSNRLLNGAFCVLPFIEQFTDLDGSTRLCCYSNYTIDNIHSADSAILRNKIWNGEKIKQCQVCYDLENRKALSPRLTESVRWLKKLQVKEYIESWTPKSETKIFFYDLRVDNKCNLACISCQPKYSSLWAKELGVEIAKTPISLDIESIKQAEKVYLAGGEPLLIPYFIELITTISKLDNQPELVINTNLTKVNAPLKKLLSKIKNLTLTVSVDGYDKVNEYHRWPMKWKKFQDNLTWIKSNLDCTVQFNTVLDAVSIIGVGDLIEIEGLVDYWNLHIITGPRALLVNNLPEDQKLAITNRFQKIKQSRFYTTDPVFKTRVDSAIEQIKQPGDHSLLSNFILELDQRRKINHSTYLGVKLT